MSYDLEIWSARPFKQDSSCQQKVPRRSATAHPPLSGPGWQIVINSSDRVLPEDVDAEVSALVPGIAWLTELNLEGKATNQAVKLLHSTAKEIARRAHGVIVDPQEDSVSTPSGVTRFVPPKKEKTFSVLTLSWWFLTDVMLKAAGRRKFLTLLEKLLPEALPKRYGSYEPPQHLFAKTGMAHLERFIGRHLDDAMAWYANRPVTHVSVSCPKQLGPSEDGFRTHLVEVQVERSVLAQPGWAENLQQFWRQLTFLLRPIYSEVRTEGGYSRLGGAIMFDAAALQQTYPHTTRSWFWRGVPRRLGHAVVLGRVYQRLWPAFLKKATMEKGFAFATTPDWSANVDLLKTVGPAPKAITLLPGEGLGPKQKYPRVWPFDPPFRPDR